MTHNCSRNGALLKITKDSWMFYTVNIKRSINAKTILGISVIVDQYKLLQSMPIQVTTNRNTLIVVLSHTILMNLMKSG